MRGVGQQYVTRARWARGRFALRAILLACFASEREQRRIWWEEIPGAALHTGLGTLGERQTQGRSYALPVSETSVKGAARDLAALPEASLILSSAACGPPR